MREIVAIKIGSKITTSMADFEAVSAYQIPFTMISKKLAQAMAECDLGYHWEQLAKREPMFLLEDI